MIDPVKVDNERNAHDAAEKDIRLRKAVRILTMKVQECLYGNISFVFKNGHIVAIKLESTSQL